MHKIIYFSVLLLLTNIVAIAQQSGKMQLEKQRAVIQQEIDNAKRSLYEIRKNKKISLGELNAVNEKLSLRQKEIGVINQQMRVIDENINQSWKDIANLKNELDTLKLQYAGSAIYAYKNRSSYDVLNFIFSAGNFNEAVKLFFYLKSYRAYREEEANNIIRTEQQLQGKIAGLNQNKEQRALALREKDNVKEKLKEEKWEKDEVIKKIKAREYELNKEIASKKKKDIKLSNAITEAIKRAKFTAVANAKKHTEIITKKDITAIIPDKHSIVTTEKKVEKNVVFKPLNATPSAKLLSEKFEKNQHNLPWPLESGRISMHFGAQIIPPNIKINNNFLTFETEAYSPVQVVFDGEVTLITYIGSDQAIVVRHGKYFTSYSNLASVSVTTGQQVKIGQTIGKIAQKVGNIGELEFGICDDTNRNFDPEKWLR